MAVLDLSCSMHDLVPWPGVEPRPPALGTWSFSHWINREVPWNHFYKNESRQEWKFSPLCITTFYESKAEMDSLPELPYTVLTAANSAHSALLSSFPLNLTVWTLSLMSSFSLSELPRCAVVKNPHANAGGIRHLHSIPGSGRSPGRGHGNPFQYSCWRIPRTEEPDGLQSMWSQRVRH